MTGHLVAVLIDNTHEFKRKPFEQGCQTMLLDGVLVRQGLCSDLGFSALDRKGELRRFGETAKLFFEQGTIVVLKLVETGIPGADP